MFSPTKYKIEERKEPGKRSERRKQKSIRQNNNPLAKIKLEESLLTFQHKNWNRQSLSIQQKHKLTRHYSSKLFEKAHLPKIGETYLSPSNIRSSKEPSPKSKLKQMNLRPQNIVQKQNKKSKLSVDKCRMQRVYQFFWTGGNKLEQNFQEMSSLSKLIFNIGDSQPGQAPHGLSSINELSSDCLDIDSRKLQTEQDSLLTLIRATQQ